MAVLASPDIAVAIDRLARDGVLTADQATLFGRVARAELATLSPLLSAALYGGVLAIVAGVGLLLAERAVDLGPLALAALIGAAAVACLAWVARTSPPFNRGAVPAPAFAFDYVLLLGALLLAADLAWIEAQFTTLGPNWPWQLLLVALLFGALAVRYDSRTVFGLALANFAAWRGIAVLSTEQALLPWTFAGSELAVRANALVCGLLFVALGSWLLRARLKPHFEAVATLLGWALTLAAVAGGLWGGGDTATTTLNQLALLGLGLFLAIQSWRGEAARQSELAGRYWLLVMGVLAAWIAGLALTLPWLPGTTGLLYVAATAGGVFALLLRANRRRRSAPP